MSEITVAILTYNRASDFLKEAVQSILGQTYKDIKILVLDDCSTDNTKELVQSFNDPRLIYLCNETNLGQFENVNKAIELCETEYLSIFHDDDRMFPWAIEEQINIMKKNKNASVVTSSILYRLQENEPSFKRPVIYKKTFYKRNQLVKKICKKGFNVVMFPGAMFRVKDFFDSGLRFTPAVGVAADMYFWIEANLSERWKDICLVDIPLIEYRIHCNNESGRAKDLEKWTVSHKKIYDLLKNSPLLLELDRISAYFILKDLEIFFPDRKNSSMGKINERRVYLKETYGIDVTDSLLKDNLTLYFLSPSIEKLVSGEYSLRQFLGDVKIMQEKGIPLSLKKLFLWVLKYGIFPKFAR